MSHRFLLRLMLDLIGMGLLLACLAYYWLDNLAHELMGTGLFLLLIAHAVFNRRWYRALFDGRYDTRRRIGIAVNLSFLAVMLALAITSLIVSRSLLTAFALDDDVAVRQIHKLAAYWAVAVLGLHLGLNWSIVMNVVRHALGLVGARPLRSWALRVVAGVIAAFGIENSFAMTFGSKLLLHTTLDMWDFNEETPRFFVNYLSIIGLYAALAHYALALIPRRGRRSSPLPVLPEHR
ncbi:DUF4405 domain-containing protein [Ancylobacter defluvii]|nr:DUF4405 domain-containing protein [Ancylobacter defluvii]